MSIVRRPLAWFRPNSVWSMALYRMEGSFSFDKKLRNPIKVFNSKSLRTRISHAHTRADPFLYVYQSQLYILFELQCINHPGYIAAYRTSNLIDFDDLGVVLREPHHLSYPMIFENGDALFMIPESAGSGETWMYRFDEFPHKLSKVRRIIGGGYFDTGVIRRDGLWYIFTTSPDGLIILYTDDIVNGDLVPHPMNPITLDRTIFRNAGAPISVNGDLIRLAQDGSRRYGANLNALRIIELTPTAYREELIVRDYFDCNERWNSTGGHHLSIARFLGDTIVAVDGSQHDYLLNKMLSPVFSGLARII
jgi:hypothetical protein